MDLICGGFPCTDLSVAGRREGLRGKQSGLFFEIIRIVEEMREETNGISPGLVVLENVPGLLSSNGGRDFGAVLSGLAESGAVDIGWRILDSQWFGVAQRRRRVFIVADFRGERVGEILAISEGMFGHPASSREAGEGTARSVARCLRAQSQLAHNEASDTLIPFDTTQLSHPANHSNPKPGDPCHPLAAGAHAPAVAPTLGKESFSPAKSSSGQMIDFIMPGTVPRRLTPTECERLQGFPDGWTDVDGMKDGPRYRMMGNAVTVNVLEWIGHRIMQAEGVLP